MQSGSPTSPWGYHALEEAEYLSRTIARRACHGAGFIDADAVQRLDDDQLLDCLLAMNETHLRRWHAEFWEWTDADSNYLNTSLLFFPFAPTIDGVYVNESPSERLLSGRVVPVDLVVGSNLNEGK